MHVCNRIFPYNRNIAAKKGRGPHHLPNLVSLPLQHQRKTLVSQTRPADSIGN